MRAQNIGLALAVTSAATFGTAGTFATSLIDAGWTPGAAVVVRVSVAALVLTVPALAQLRGRWALLRSGLRTVVPFGLLGIAGAQLFFFNAVSHLSVGVALLLEYSGTLLVVLWLWLRHGQRPSRVTSIGGVCALVGMGFVLDLTGDQHVDVVGVLWGLGAAVGLATYFTTSASPAGTGSPDPLPPLVTVWGGMVLAALALGLAASAGLLPFRTSSADTVLAGHAVSWIVPVLGVSLVAAVAAYVTGVAATRRLGARLASFVGLAEVLSAVLIAWAALGQRPGLTQAIGGVIVLAGIALVRAGEPEPPSTESSESAPEEPLELPV